MTMSFGGQTNFSAHQADVDTTDDETMNSDKTGLSNSTTKNTNTSVTVNSGSTNTGRTTTSNSGSVNTNNTVNNTDSSVNKTHIGETSSTQYNSGRVDTSQVMLTKDAVDHLVQGMLESNQGLAAVSSGAKATGGYNSTASSQLTNDLLSRVAGEVAVRGSKTVNTIGASYTNTNNSGRDDTQYIGATKSNSSSTQNIGASTSENDVLQTIGGSTSSTTGDAISDMVTYANERVNATKHGYTQQDVRETNEEQKASANFSWIICTELAAQKKLNLKFYLSGLAVFNSYKDEYKRGYYIWGVPVVKYIRKHPDSWVTKMWVSISNARIEYLAALGGNKRAKKTVYGFVMTYSLYYLCVVLSKTLARNYTLTSAD